MSPAFDVPVIRSRVLARPRLATVFGSGTDRPFLTIVHAAAGAGKSTAIAQWANAVESADEDLIWITLNRDDAESLPFWSRLTTSLIRHGIVPPLDAATAQSAASSELYDARERLLGALETVGRPVTLVLDDYHLVAHDHLDAELQDVIARCERLRVVIGTRTMGILDSITFAAHVSTKVITAEDLAFTLAESTELVQARMPGDDSGLASAIFSASRGWPLASQAMLVEAERDPESRRPITSIGNHRSLFVNELVRTTLEPRNAESREFVLRLALADEATVELASEITGASTTAITAEFDQLERDGIGSWQLRSGTGWFRVHPLLLEAFRERASTELDAVTVSGIRAALSDYLHDSRPLRALELAMEIQDWRRVEDLYFLRFGLLTNFHRESSARLLYSVPPEAFESNPSLFATRLVYEFGAPRSRENYYSVNFPVLYVANRKRSIREPSVAAALGEIMWTGVHRLLGQQEMALELADRAANLLENSTHDDRESHPNAVALLHVQLGVTHLLAGQYLRAKSDLEHGFEIAQRNGSANEAFQAKSMLAMAAAVGGTISTAAEWVEAASRESALNFDGWLGRYLGAGRKIASTYVHLNNWDAAAADSTIAELESRSQGLEYWPDMLIARAWTDLLLHGAASAHAALVASIAEKTRRAPAQREPGARLAATNAHLLLLAGQPIRAIHALDECEDGNNPEILIIRSRIALAKGDLATAIRIADGIARTSLENVRLRTEAFLVIAAANAQAGQHDGAAESFSAAIGTMSGSGLRLPLFSVAQGQIDELLALTRERNIPIDESVLAGVPRTQSLSVHVEPLSGAERRVLRALIDDSDVNSVATDLHLSTHTVRYHLKRSYRKLGVSTRHEAIMLAQQLGMLD